MPQNFLLDHTCPAPFHTDLRYVFQLIGVDARDFDWFVSDLDYVVLDREPERRLFEPRDQWLNGVELHQIIQDYRIQFVWGVFSAVPKGTRFEVEDPPYSDENDRLWSPDYQLQLPGAVFEIIGWDNSCTFLMGLDQSMANRVCSVMREVRNRNQGESS